MLTYMRGLLAADKDEFIRAVSVSSGSGTTITTSGLSGVPDDFFKGKELQVTTGSNNGSTRKILSWVESTQTLTISKALPFSLTGSDSIFIYDAGFWSDTFLINTLNEAQDRVLVDVDPEFLHDFMSYQEKSGTLSSTDPFASGEMPIDQLKILDVFIDERWAPEVKNRNRFYTDSYLDRGWFVIGQQLGQTETQQLLYVPNTNSIIKYKFIKRADRISINDNCELPAIYHEPVTRLATSIAYGRDEELSPLGAKHEQAYIQFVNSRNNK